MQKKIMLALIISSNGMIIGQQPQVATNGTVVQTPAATISEQPANVPAQAPITPTTPTTPPRVEAGKPTQPPTINPAAPGIAEAVTPASAAVIPQTGSPITQPTVPVIQPAQQTITGATTGAVTQAAVTPEQPQPIEQPPASIETPAVTQPTEKPQPAEQPNEQPTPIEMPKAEEFKPQPEAPEEDLEIKGIDTVDINEPKGNWLYKRIWWEKAERTYEKIKQLTDKILESRMNFFVKRNQLDRAIVEFYSDLGFKEGELTELFDFMTRQLNLERQTSGSLTEKEQELLDLLTQEKKNIEQLQQGGRNIKKIDEALEDALMKLLEQLNQAKYYEQQAWEHFKAINRELSDKKARELFYSMDTYWRNLNSINSYLSDAFAQYFDQLGQKLQQETDKMKTNVQALSEKGISLESQAAAMKRECKLPSKEEGHPEETEQPSGILGTLWNWIKAPFSAVGGIFNWVTGLFGGQSEEITSIKPAREKAGGE